MTDRKTRIDRLLVASREGDPDALDRLFPLLYDDLRRIARGHLRRERDGHTLSTTALVHEAYVGLAEGSGEWTDRTHFLAVASTAMRHVLVDYARRRNAQKRGGDRVRVTLDGSMARADTSADTADLIALNDALRRLGEKDPRLERVVECRFFGGMTVAETASALDTSQRTVERAWTRARTYLYRALSPAAPDR